MLRKMVCERCYQEVMDATGNHPESLADCICSDIDERIKNLSESPYWDINICKRCDKIWTRCNCPRPIQ